jgi:O-glycosyl hydrolase
LDYKSRRNNKVTKTIFYFIFTTASNSFQNIEIDPSKTYQTIDGFGYTLTGGSVEVINQLSASKKEASSRTFWKRRKFYRDKLS